MLERGQHSFKSELDLTVSSEHPSFTHRVPARPLSCKFFPVAFNLFDEFKKKNRVRS